MYAAAAAIAFLAALASWDAQESVALAVLLPVACALLWGFVASPLLADQAALVALGRPVAGEHR